MKLLRFALLTFDASPENWREWTLRTDGARIQTEWARELEAGKLSVFVIAETNLSERPVVNEDGLVIVPEGPLKRAESLIETSANLVAVSERCTRSISSPIPAVAFLPEDEETRAWLDDTNGIFMSGSGIVSVGGFRVDSDTTLKLTSDRPDGAALLAEALSHNHPTGMFHELLRVFERAFRLTSSALVTPLAEFLEGADMGYSRAEVKRWLTELRHPATHADKRASFILESDIRPVIPRMIQAAYDVLFNKDSWRTPSTQRREVWRPPAGISGEEESSDVFKSPESTMELKLERFDEVGSYPMNLNLDISRVIPPEMWAKWPSKTEDDSPQ
jgi:hypothetical protein